MVCAAKCWQLKENVAQVCGLRNGTEWTFETQIVRLNGVLSSGRYGV
jgi:hypothetical protein